MLKDIIPSGCYVTIVEGADADHWDEFETKSLVPYEAITGIQQHKHTDHKVRSNDRCQLTLSKVDGKEVSVSFKKEDTQLITNIEAFVAEYTAWLGKQ